ncbi:MipA/OmpV family protein [Sphingopyxis sp. MWB1]|uniref:MipA/OmpV family protein n=1 Tax=Sphingopyxis sp. MWB1 TaxID=1537715 RepID=UPI0006906962|nr:MipA/OmpV family protein [Sphingopyxis sp. MWB1]
MSPKIIVRSSIAVFLVTATPAPLHAQTGEEAPMRTRVFLGPQMTPEYPGSKDMSIGPFLDLSRSPVGTPMEFEAPDESAGLGLLGDHRFSIGPAVNLLGKRRASDTDDILPSIKRSIELGGFVQAWITPEFRLRAEARKAVSGHKGWNGDIGVDYVAREGDDWLLSVGPRVTLGDAQMHRTYFGVTPSEAAASDLDAFDPGGGIRSVGMTVGYLHQFDRHWGVAGYARYDRLVGDAASSPVTRSFGTRSQPSAGIALSYTFGGAR